MKKKLLSALLVAAMAVSTLAGCGSSTTETPAADTTTEAADTTTEAADTSRNTIIMIPTAPGMRYR